MSLSATIRNIAFAAAMVCPMAASADELLTRKALSLSAAEMMASACAAAQNTGGWSPVAISILDSGGNLVLFHRQDGAALGASKISQVKAESAANFARPTRAWGERAFGKDGEPAEGPAVAFVPGIAPFTGGLPIVTAEGEHLGGIGVSGATGDQDEQCAQAGIDAIADLLN